MLFHFAFLAFAAAIGHIAAMFFAMLISALMSSRAFVMGAMAGIAMLCHCGFVMRAMVSMAVRLGIGIIRAMPGTNLIFFTWVFGAMFGTIMFRQGFVFAMFDAGFAFFTFMLGAMLDAIMFGGRQLLVFTVFRLHWRR